MIWNCEIEKAEVLGVVLSTFNKELYEKNLKEDAYNEGIHKKLCQLVKIKLSKGKTVAEIADALEEDVETIQKLIYELTDNETTKEI